MYSRPAKMGPAKIEGKKFPTSSVLPVVPTIVWYPVECVSDPTSFNSKNMTGHPDGVEIEVISPKHEEIISWNDLKPEEKLKSSGVRFLTVKGTVKGAKEVKVNGVSAKVKDGNWTASGPVAAPGFLRLRATAVGTGVVHSINVAILGVFIEEPKQNAIFWIEPSPPTMPSIKCRVKIMGLTDSKSVKELKFYWKLEIGGKYVKYVYDKTKKERNAVWKEYYEEFKIDADDMPSDGYEVDFKEKIPSDRWYGGWGKLIVTAELNAKKSNWKVESIPCWIDIKGKNPNENVIIQFIKDNVDALKLPDILTGFDNTLLKIQDIIVKIMRHESKLRQFQENGIKEIENDTRIKDAPLKRPLNCRPVFGPPAGFGIAQRDPAEYPDEYWNWQKNVIAGIKIYKEDLGFTMKGGLKSNYQSYNNKGKLITKNLKVPGLRKIEEERIEREKKNLEVYLKERTSKLPDIPEKPKVAELELEQILRDATRHYNCGLNAYQYYFDARYAVVKQMNGVFKVEIRGEKKWIETCGNWIEAEDGMEEIEEIALDVGPGFQTLILFSSWRNFEKNPNYVKDVLG